MTGDDNFEDRVLRRTTKPCPDCAEQVQERARVCRYCGYDFETTELEDDAPGPKPTSRFPWKTLAAITTFVFLLWLLGLCSYTPASSGDHFTMNADDPLNATVETGPNEGADPAPSTQPSAVLSVSQLLRRGDAHACIASQVTDYLTKEIQESLAAQLRSQIQVRLSEIGQRSIDRDTSQMGCHANARITTQMGTKVVQVQYMLSPALESEYDVLITDNWRAVAQTAFADEIDLERLGQFLDSTSARTTSSNEGT